MTPAVISAISLMLTLLIEQTVMAALPFPWREIPLLLVVALVIMHRVSLEIGVAFFLAGVAVIYGSGMSGFDTLLVAVLTMGGAVFFSTRIFARRSLAAFFGFSLGTALVYQLAHMLSLLIKGSSVSVLAELFFIGITAASAFVLSLLVGELARNFGLRFVQKETTYEVRQTS